MILNCLIKFLKSKPSLNKVEAIAILTEWNEFKNFDFEKLVVFDGRNILRESNKFYQIGR